ncbi:MULTISPECIES: LysE family translocator [Rhodomicrobium]|uniref:LysE family translocator n=1 Tax=Rhodomicrobium TaxID=1068 RepID=UPI0014836E79|nr:MULTISPECIES: LysE family translocator [Rhodomicrobium]
MDARAVPVLLAVSITPGLCMMLALTLGATIGVRRAMWMMIGELIGLGLVSVLSLTGVAAIMMGHSDVYAIGKAAGGLYLLYIGVQIARTDFQVLAGISKADPTSAGAAAAALVTRGFLVAIGNPKSWLFYAALLPPFIRPDRPLLPQVAWLVSLLLLIEFLSLMLYAGGGRAARTMLQSEVLARAFFFIAGAIIFGFGIQILLEA